MITRTLHKKVSEMARKFPVVAILGPRQSGKTTLARSLFPHKPYVSLENPDTRAYAVQDPRGFLKEYAKGAVLDEVQRTPDFFSYLQTHVDLNPAEGSFILTGSQNFLLLENISQTLAGRVRILTLLPYALSEVLPSQKKEVSAEHFMLQGMYPRLYDKHLHPSDWYPDYIRTYLEKDVRSIKNVHDLSRFHRFLQLCAGRTGCVLNLSSLANDCGITHNTAAAWLSVLEASFLVHLLPSYHRNFNKQIVKSPKLYLIDTGLACSLLGIETLSHLKNHPLRGALFETLVISEMLKHRLHQGKPPHLYFWRDKTGHEIDALLQKGSDMTAVEIQAGETITTDSLKNLFYWGKLTRQTERRSFLIHAGEQEQTRGSIHVHSWRSLAKPPKEFAS